MAAERYEGRLSLFYFVFFLAVGISSPYLQILLAGLGYSKATIGVLQALFDMVGLAGPLLVGPFADRTRRHRAIIAVLLATIPLSLFPLVRLPLLPVTALCLALYSVGIRSIMPVSDALAHEVLPDARTSYGRIRAWGTAGFILISLLIQFARLVDSSSPESIALWTGAGVVAALLSAALLPASGARQPVARGAGPRGQGAGKLSRASAWIHGALTFAPGFWLGLSVIALGRLGSVPFNSFLSLFVKEAVKVDWVSGMWALGAIVEIPFMVFSGAILERIGLVAALAASLAAVAVRLALCAFFPTPWALVLGQLLHSLSFGLFYPVSVAFIASSVNPRRRGLGMALNLSVASALPSLAGNLAGGLIIDATGGYALFFGIAIVFPLLGLALLPLLRARMMAADGAGGSVA